MTNEERDRLYKFANDVWLYGNFLPAKLEWEAYALRKLYAPEPETSQKAVP